MTVTVLLHLDFIDSGSAVWWAESPEVPGFSAAADTLLATRIRAEEAIREILAERGENAAALQIEFRLVPVPLSEGVPAELQVEGGTTPPAVGPRVEQVAERVA